MIDIWLLANMVVPFLEVLLHTYIDNKRHGGGGTGGKVNDVHNAHKRDSDAKRAEIMAKRGLPIVFGAFTAAYFVVGFSQPSRFEF